MILVSLPVDQPLYGTPLSKKIKDRASFPRGLEYDSFRIETEMVWKAIYSREGWEEYHYALKYARMLKSHFLKFKRLLCRLSGMEEAPTQIHNSGASV